MAGRHSDEDGSDTFWPGYVDAVTNLVLNLLFLLTIMTVAVFMFALELGRASRGGPSKPDPAVQKPAAVSTAQATADPVRENLELKREIERLNRQLSQRELSKKQPVHAGGPTKTVDVTSRIHNPTSGLDKTVATDLEIQARFKDDAVAFTSEEQNKLRDDLQAILAKGKATILVEVPAGFSEAKRMGFYRAMAVRNILIEMNMPREAINVSVIEGPMNANAALVRIK